MNQEVFFVRVSLPSRCFPSVARGARCQGKPDKEKERRSEERRNAKVATVEVAARRETQTKSREKIRVLERSTRNIFTCRMFISGVPCLHASECALPRPSFAEH